MSLWSALASPAAFQLLAASEWWVTRWLTPFWIFGVGIAVGLLAAAALWLVIYALSLVPGVAHLRRHGIAFWIGVAGGAALAGAVGVATKGAYVSPATSEFIRDEWLMLLSSVWAFGAVTIWTLLYCANSRFIQELWQTITTGIGGQIALALLCIVAVCGAMTLVVEEPVAMLRALPTLANAGEATETVVVPGVRENEIEGVFEQVRLGYNPLALARVIIRSDRNVVLSVDDPEDTSPFVEPIQVLANQPIQWNRFSNAKPPVPISLGAELRVQNEEYEPATITFQLLTAAERPEMKTAAEVGLLVFVLAALWFLQLGAAPRLAAIAMSTAKSELSQPLPKILMLFVALCIALFVFVPFHTLGEDIKLLKESGVTLIMVATLFQGVWSASNSVSDEIEGRTALTLLSKPIRRRSFIFGKYIGIVWLLVLMVVVLGAVELLAVAYKPLYDARENSLETPLWQLCHIEMRSTLPGILMVLMQVTVLTGLAVALATRLTQLANFAVCFAVYLVGHLTPAIVSSSQDTFPIVEFVGQLIAVLTPNLDLFSMHGAIDANTMIPSVYLSALLVYSMLYCGLVVLLGLLLFEDRDLA